MSAPLVPVIVKGQFPAATVLSVRTVRVELPAPVMVVGLNVPVAPEGRPLTLEATWPANPFWTVVVAV